jgi:hypothetical protein
MEAEDRNLALGFHLEGVFKVTPPAAKIMKRQRSLVTPLLRGAPQDVAAVVAILA